MRFTLDLCLTQIPFDVMSNLVTDYLQLAREWGEIMDRGEPEASKDANDLYDRIQRTFDMIRDSGQEQILFGQAVSEDDPVQFCIASHIKEQDVPRAIELYQHLADSRFPFVKVSASWILRDLTRGD